MTRRPSTKSLLSQMTMSTQTLRGEKTCKGRGGVVFRDRPATGRFSRSRVVLSPETELKPNGDCVAIEARSGFLAALVGHFRRFKLRLTLDDLRSVVTTIVLVPVR